MTVGQMLELISEYEVVTIEYLIDTIIGPGSVVKTLSCKSWNNEPEYSILCMFEVDSIFSNGTGITIRVKEV